MSQGAFDKLINGMDSGVNAVFSGIDKALASSDAKKRWRQLFPQLSTNERLIGEYNGQALDGNSGPVSCTVYLSDTHFSFAIVHPYGGKTKVSFPYTEIANAQRGIYVRVPMPHIVPQQSPAERTDSLLVFLRSGEVHMLTTFLHYQKLCAALFPLWNAFVKQPVVVAPQPFPVQTLPQGQQVLYTYPPAPQSLYPPPLSYEQQPTYQPPPQQQLAYPHDQQSLMVQPGFIPSQQTNLYPQPQGESTQAGIIFN